MIFHATLHLTVVECGEWGLIDVNGVGVQQVHELGSCIVRTTAIVNDNKHELSQMAKSKENCHDRRGIPSGHFVKHLACGGSSTVERHRRGTSFWAEGVDEGAGFFVVGILFRFTPETLPTFSAAGRDHATALVPGARAAGIPPCTTTLL